MEKVVTDVLSRLSWSEDVDEASMAQSPGENPAIYWWRILQDLDCREEVVRNDFSVAQTLMVTFFTCVLFKATLGGNKVDRSLQNNVKFHRLGLNTINTLVLLMICILSPNQVWSQEENIRKKYDKRYPWQQWILRILRRMNLMTWQNHDMYLTERDRQCARTQHIGSFWKMLNTEDWYLGNSNAISLRDSVPADCLWKVVKHTNWKDSVSEDSLITASPPTVSLRNAWQVQHEDHHPCGSGTGQPVADEGKMEPNRSDSGQVSRTKTTRGASQNTTQRVRQFPLKSRMETKHSPQNRRNTRNTWNLPLWPRIGSLCLRRPGLVRVLLLLFLLQGVRVPDCDPLIVKWPQRDGAMWRCHFVDSSSCLLLFSVASVCPTGHIGKGRPEVDPQ